jgi:hypothetical protein
MGVRRRGSHGTGFRFKLHEEWSINLFSLTISYEDSWLIVHNPHFRGHCQSLVSALPLLGISCCYDPLWHNERGKPHSTKIYWVIWNSHEITTFDGQLQGRRCGSQRIRFPLKPACGMVKTLTLVYGVIWVFKCGVNRKDQYITMKWHFLRKHNYLVWSFWTRSA